MISKARLIQLRGTTEQNLKNAELDVAGYKGAIALLDHIIDEAEVNDLSELAEVLPDGVNISGISFPRTEE